ncbi:hypothetical protein FQN54_008394 [Arachnomyces sp. PD_36]|nr:hypothetical protein FQN54_008394 [Arachnomyces sp. PD_36]
MAPSKARRWNPIAFRPWPVTTLATIVYFALLVPLIVIHNVVPTAPEKSPKGLDLNEAWTDLQHLTAGFHPYNSRRNDEVHDWLLERIDSILNERTSSQEDQSSEDSPDTFVFNDNQSNLTFFSGGVLKASGLGVYIEGTNIIVYIRGFEDDVERWWETPDGEPTGSGGVLVNAHYDSVSTGYGATDDGVGVITLLQLIRYFTSPGNAPRKGLVLLFNNGEEDFLNGARVYSQHPISKFAHTFLNLEGAGAGGRATLFRSTDTEVTRFYKNSEHPFGSVLSADGFERGMIRSQTDYVVFNGDLGLRGLDVAFMEPRSMYHTDRDDTRHTSIDSLWHMLSAAVATTEGLVSDPSSTFDGEATDDGKVPSGTGTRGVWFDLFGSAFAVFQLHTLFALSVTLLVVGPIVLIVTSIGLSRADRMYLFSNSQRAEEGGEKVSLYGLRGLFRYPFIFAVSTAACVALAYLLTKVNPYIIHSSEYAVWSMMFSAWVFLAWFLSRTGDFFRPSALHRAYSLTWIFVLTWALLVANTVFEKRLGIAGGYFIFFYFAGTFLATWISYLELFALIPKAEYGRQLSGAPRRPSSLGSRLLTPSADERASESIAHESGDEEATESTSLLRGEQRTTFANYTRTNEDDDEDDTAYSEARSLVFGYEQPWSVTLPSWTWILQFLLVGPIAIILVGQLGLLLTSAIHQTGQDGSSVLIAYLMVAIFTTLLLIPVSPFLHRFTYHIPILLFLVLIGTLVYNLTAFPFSSSNRLKVSFIQEVDLDTGSNRVSISGVSPYVRDILDSIPSADSDAHMTCSPEKVETRQKCSWDGLEPQVIEANIESSQFEERGGDTDWLSLNTNRTDGENTARFEVSGRNSRACKLTFDTPVSSFTVLGSATDSRFPVVDPNGTKEIRLWSRTWENTWTVDLEWENEEQLSGRVICLWSDNNQVGTIPALDELRHYAPNWVAITKAADGLVEGSRAFTV